MAKAKSEDQEPDFSGLDDLPEEQPVEVPPASEAKPEAPESEEPEAEGQAEASAAEPEEDDPLVEVAGVTRKRSEWQKFLQDSDTWRNQASHFQGKYTDLLEQVRGAKPESVPKEGQPAQGPTPEQIDQFYAPAVKAAIEKKAFGEEVGVFAETWPSAFAQALFRFDSADNRLARLESAVLGYVQRDREQAFSNARATFDATLDDLAAQEQFSAFSDAKAREGYRDYFIENFGHLPLEKLTADFVRKQAVAYLAPAFEEAMKAAQPKAKPTRRNAAGEGSAARPSGRSVETELERQFKELDEA